MNTTQSPGIEAKVAAVFVEIFSPVAQNRGLQIFASTSEKEAILPRISIHAVVQDEETAVKLPDGVTAQLLEVTLNLHASATDRSEDWLNETIQALERQRDQIGTQPLSSLSSFMLFEIQRFGAQPLSFDKAKWMKQFSATVCALLQH